MPYKVYVASSWRNELHSEVVELCKSMDFTVYDFKNPENGKPFRWSECAEPGKNWQEWTEQEYKVALETKRAREGFASDFDALNCADICILVLPAGVSAALEFGYACGNGCETVIIGMPREPDLMLKMGDYWAKDMDDLKSWLLKFQNK